MIAPALKVLSQGRINQDLLTQISDEVAFVEEELQLQVRSKVELIEQVGQLTLLAGGKRLRPAFVSLAAKATGLPFDVERTRLLGASLEMIHMATLIHDDVIDHASTRRGRPTASAEYGNTAAILAGDALLARAMLILSRDGDVDLVRVVAESVAEIAQGEVRELEVRGDFDLDEATHLEILRMKTASFIECCCEVGAMVAGATRETCLALRAYGHHVGMAFQIADDLLDYRGDRSKTGKPRAADFREGQATLPLIYLRDRLSSEEAAVVRQGFGNNPSEDEIRLLTEWMEQRGAFERAEKIAREHTARATAAIDHLPATVSRELLETVAEYVVRRDR
ncbi:polyprenyl synthetase family protein [Fimbriimonas ginsengisoli]|uniref:Polyprenyl synthetase n=1 Tax=Fimbriimonas ginsengisoli Gsoil 348 TaxID=661478 RepID=A0A068NR51_FIMGI|nr:polyprenyl synthetase family protein [Fimbriimonas ginsengisoli]AIE85240.1 polyprenyl synthetase [Fimbriimonas ginsengisoli Gsoil 348]